MVMIISVFVLQGIIFAGLIFMLRHFMKGNVKGELGHLDKLHEELLKREADLKAKMQAAEQEYTSKAAKMEQEMSTRHIQAKQEASKLLAEGKELALKERERIINEAVSTRDKMRQEIMAEMEEKAISYSRNILAEFFSGEYRILLQKTLMEQLITGLESVSTEQFQASSEKATLRSADPLTDEDRKRIQKVLKAKTHQEVAFKEEVQPELIGGVILQFGNLVIDGSMINLLNEAGARLKKEAQRRFQNTA